MTIFLPFLVSYLVTVSAISLIDFLPEGNRWCVPGKDFNFTWVTRQTVEDELISLGQKLDIATYHLYTKMNPDKDQKLRLNDTKALTASNFNGKNPTRIIIHGFQSSHRLSVCTLPQKAFLKIGSYNIICVDWNPLAKLTYVAAKSAVPSVGNHVKLFIDFLISFGGMQLKDVKIIGHSLGAHIAGFAGKGFQIEHVPHIIGLDPALPLFSYKDCTSRLCKTDAKYVESIQTGGSKLGFLKPIGDPAFYPNGGKYQIGCGLDLSGTCSHLRSYIYYAEATEKDNFPTVKCSSYLDAVAKSCGVSYSGTKMTSPNYQETNGTFYVPVNSKPDYGKG